MTPKDITVVFVPGAWHSPNGYDAVIADLHKAGYNTSKVWTPSVVRPGASPIPSLDADVEAVRQNLDSAINSGQKVVLVLHSYGGVPGSQAAEGYDQASFAAKGHTDGRGLIHVVYLASFMIRAGESLLSVQGGGPAPWVKPLGDGTTTVIDPATVFYNDFDSQEEVERFVADLNPMSIGPLTHELSHEPWQLVPTTYVLCENDNAIPVSWQRGFVKNAIEAGAVDLRSVQWKCGHTVFAVRPLGVSKLIQNAVVAA